MKKKLNEKEVRKICELIIEGRSGSYIAREFNVTRQCISLIKKRRTFTHITRYYNLEHEDETGKSLHKDTIKQICDLINEGYDSYSIYLMTGISIYIIGKIRHGEIDISLPEDFQPTNRRKPYKAVDPLSVKEITTICEMMVDGYRDIDISLKTNRSISTITRIRKGERHTNISYKYNIPEQPKMTRKPRKYDEDTILRVCEMIQDHYTNIYISKVTGISDRDVSLIRNGRLYRHISSKYTFPTSRKNLINPDKNGFIDTDTTRTIRELINKGYDDIYISNETGVNKDKIHGIRLGIAYQDISSKYNFS